MKGTNFREIVGSLSPQYDGFSRCKLQIFQCGVDSTCSLFHVYVCHSGANQVFLYTLTVKCVDDAHDQIHVEKMDVDDKTEDTNKLHWKFLFDYKMTILLTFPVHSVVSLKNKVWAFGLDNQIIDLEDIVNGRSKSDAMLINYFEVNKTISLKQQPEQSSQINDIAFSAAGLLRKKQKFQKHISPCCLCMYLSESLLVCRENALEECWTLEVFYKGSVTLLPSVPFRQELHDLHEASFAGISGLGKSLKKFHPSVMCVTTGADEEADSENIMEKSLFNSLFDFGDGAGFTSVVLFGAPDGRVLWTPLKCLGQTTNNIFKILCNIEEGVVGIHLCKRNNLTDSKNDVLLIVGSLGKIGIFSVKSGAPTNYGSINITTCCIPGPISPLAFCHSTVYYSAHDSQMWMSRVVEDSEKNLNLRTECLGMTNIMMTASLGDNGLLLCVQECGNIYILKPNFKDGHQNVSNENLLDLFTTCSMQSIKLHQLEAVKLKQSLVLSHLAAFTSFAKGTLPDDVLSCHIDSIHRDFINMKATIGKLSGLNVHTTHSEQMKVWTLCFAVYNKDGLSSIKKNIWFDPSSEHTTEIEIDKAFTQFTSSTSFSWHVQASLLFNLPIDTQKQLYCDEMPNVPFCFVIKTDSVNELSFLKAENDTLKHPEFKARSLFLSLYDLCKVKRPSLKPFKMMDEKNTSIPTSLTLSLCEATCQVLTAATGETMCAELLKLILKDCDTITPSGTAYVNYFGNPVRITAIKKGKILLIEIRTKPFDLLVKMRMAIQELLYKKIEAHDLQKKRTVCISNNLLEKLEGVSRDVNHMLESDCLPLRTEEEGSKLFKLYDNMRKNISCQIYF